MLAGRARNEDAVVLSVPPGKALVQTVDILAPIVNDAFAFGRIAAANALSDVYALGGEPWCAMNVACFPQALAEDDPEQALTNILRGGQDALLEAGAVLAGQAFTVPLPESATTVPTCTAGLQAPSTWKVATCSATPS